MVFINISLHEARDMERVVPNAHRALKPRGWSVVSDMPFPEKLEDMRPIPAQIRSGIQHFEALIDDQLLSVSQYVEDLEKAGFEEIETLDVTPIHAIVHGRK